MAEGRGQNVSSDTAAPTTTIPLLSWSQLEDRRLVSDRILSSVYSAFLRQTNDHCILVAYKMHNVEAITCRVLKEARVLQVLRGVSGVPRLYGVTKPPPKSVLVMSFCPGVPLYDYHTVEGAKVYLSALLFTCRTLRHMHERGVTHGQVEPFNILVVATQKTEAIFAFLVDFRLSIINASGQDKERDSEKLYLLILDIVDIIEGRDEQLHARCRPLLAATHPRLDVIEAGLHAALCDM